MSYFYRDGELSDTTLLNSELCQKKEKNFGILSLTFHCHPKYVL